MLPCVNRLTGFEVYSYLKQKGEVCDYPGYRLIKVKDVNLSLPKFGIIVSTKVSKKAVVRNKIKRQIREEIRKGLKVGKYESGYAYLYLAH